MPNLSMYLQHKMLVVLLKHMSDMDDTSYQKGASKPMQENKTLPNSLQMNQAKGGNASVDVVKERGEGMESLMY